LLGLDFEQQLIEKARPKQKEHAVVSVCRIYEALVGKAIGSE